MTRRDIITLVVYVLAILGSATVVHLRIPIPTMIVLSWGGIMVTGLLLTLAVTVREETSNL